MPVLQEIALLLLWLYLVAQVGVVVVWLIHHHYARQGMPGLLAQRWSLLDLWLGLHLVLLLTFGALLVMGALVSTALLFFSPSRLYALWRAGYTGDTTPALFWAGILSVLLMQSAAFAAVAIWYTLVKYRQDTAEVGLSWRWEALRQGALWGVMAFPIALLLDLLSSQALRLLLGSAAFQRLSEWERQTVSLEAQLGSLPPGVLMIAFMFVVAVAAPVGEELFFRGFVFNVLRYRLRFRLAMWLSATLFALMHVSLQSFVPILATGVLLAWLYERTGSLWSSVAMHATFNLLSATAAILWGGQ
ncbi:MAG: CPBP family intramembrane glutamic endopeptidase [Armatimonadota bacterium]|nr:CPBP family intramembrane metalloprotease [bacterium]MCS7309703.1 CPBP family intramembrane metalloprotease [Armatimonadota bacterium]MDW8104595.1 CPBP family intramembrane glutamic endopeptidase [Armatimonadota bacterium]MDW8290075.1 CPBP family intramembrane glutamic endopeptidase [Armatimonadota bacterium]